MIGNNLNVCQLQHAISHLMDKLKTKLYIVCVVSLPAQVHG